MSHDEQIEEYARAFRIGWSDGATSRSEPRQAKWWTDAERAAERDGFLRGTLDREAAKSRAKTEAVKYVALMKGSGS